MKRNGVAGFNILDNNFSRDLSELHTSEIGTTALEKQFMKPIKRNIFKEFAIGDISIPIFKSIEGFYINDPSRTYPDAPTNIQVTFENNSKIKVTWDAADVAGGRGNYGTLKQHIIFLEESNGPLIYIYKTPDSNTVTYEIDLEKTYQILSWNTRELEDQYSIKPNVTYRISIGGVDLAIFNSNQVGDRPKYYTGPVGFSSQFKLMTTGAPTGVTAIPGNGSATITWNAPLIPGSDTENFYIKNKGYKLTLQPPSGAAVIETIIRSSDTETLPTSKTISSLTNNLQYTFTIQTISYLAGILSANSNQVQVRPEGQSTAPGPPTITSVTPAVTSATVNWTAPTSDGGTPIQGYYVYAFTMTNPTTTSSPSGYTELTGPTVRPATITGLTAGTEYTFIIQSHNKTGNTIRPSVFSNPVTIRLLQGAVVPTAPDRPTIVSVTPGDESATLTWSAPTSSGSSAIIGYTVIVYKKDSSGSFSIEKQVELGAINTTTISGLTNRIDYKFKVTATNSQQTSNASLFSTLIKPAATTTAPGVPRDVSAIAGDASATVNFKGPISSGSSAITKYTVTPYLGATAGGSVDVGTSASAIVTATVNDLINDSEYTFKVTATNSDLTSNASTSNTVKPVSAVRAPSAPTIISVARGNKSATVKFNPLSPDSTGGRPITKYTVTVYQGTTFEKTVEFTGSAINTTPILAEITGLTNGTAYTFKVTATNSANLPSELSSSSSSVTPNLAPGRPTIKSAIAGNKSATISWDAPAANDGTPITEYRVSSDKGNFVDVSGNLTEATISDLFNGTSYTFTVIAKNSSLIGLPSDNSVSIKPSIAVNTAEQAAQKLAQEAAAAVAKKAAKKAAEEAAAANTQPAAAANTQPGGTQTIVGGIISAMNTKTGLSYILSPPPKKDQDEEEEDISGVKVSKVTGIVKALNVYMGLPGYDSHPIVSLLIAIVLLGAISMALFSSYSPIILKSFYN